MRQLQTILLYLLMMKLLTVSSENVTVHPSSNSNPASVWMTWPQSTNRVALTIQCSSYQLKLTFKMSNGFSIGMLELKSYWKVLQIHCKEGGTSNWYGGNLLQFSTRNWGICNSGTSETLIIERTSARLKILSGDLVVFSRNWAATDGKCLSEAAFWRLQNYGTTILSARSILGKAYFILHITICNLNHLNIFVSDKISATFTIMRLISEPCEEGTYRDSTTTFCISCGTGKHSNSNNSDCGKRRKTKIFIF